MGSRNHCSRLSPPERGRGFITNTAPRSLGLRSTKRVKKGFAAPIPESLKFPSSGCTEPSRSPGGTGAGTAGPKLRPWGRSQLCGM